MNCIFQFYSLPFCEGTGKQKRHKQDLGETLSGSHKVTTPYELTYLDPVPWRSLCDEYLDAKDVSVNAHISDANSVSYILFVAYKFRSLTAVLIWNFLSYDHCKKVNFSLQEQRCYLFSKIFKNSHLVVMFLVTQYLFTDRRIEECHREWLLLWNVHRWFANVGLPWRGEIAYFHGETTLIKIILCFWTSLFRDLCCFSSHQLLRSLAIIFVCKVFLILITYRWSTKNFFLANRFRVVEFICILIYISF